MAGNATSPLSLRQLSRRVFRTLTFPPRRFVFWLNRRAGRFDEFVWLVGDARSGTSWLANLLNTNGARRELFEPCNPRHSKDFRLEWIYQYLDVDEEHPRLEAFLRKAFSGRHANRVVDMSNWRTSYDGMLIKDIFAGLFVPFALRKFPEVKTVLLIRHPFDVVISKLNSQWDFFVEPQRYMSNPGLQHKHLAPHEALIDQALGMHSPFVDGVLHWCLVNSIVLRECGGQISVIFYESLVESPKAEINRLLQELHLSWTIDHKSFVDAVSRPSKSSVRVNRSKGYNTDITPEEYEAANRLLRAFELDRLYDSNREPANLDIRETFS